MGYVLVLTFLVLQLPPVQQYLADRAVARMQTTLGTDVRLKRLRISWLDEINLVDLYIADTKGDTLLASGRVVVDFNLNPIAIYKRGIEIEALSIQGARFNIRRGLYDEVSNLEWALAKLFPAKDTITTDKRPIPLNLRELTLSDVQFTQRDSTRGNYLGAYVAEAQVYLNLLDLPGKRIDISSANIKDPRVEIANWMPDRLESDFVDKAADPADTTTFQIQVAEFYLAGGNFKLDNFRQYATKTTPNDQLDLRHLDLYDVQVEIENFALADEIWQGRVNWIAAKDRSGFKLERLSANEATVAPTHVTLNGLSVVTPTSRLGDTLVFKYQAYEDWGYFADLVRMDLRFNDADVTLQDIMAFVPGLNDNVFFRNNRQTNVQIDGRFRGAVNSLKGDNVDIRLADGTQVQGRFSSQNLAVRDEEFLVLDLKKLSTRISTLRQIIPNFRPPQTFDKLGNLNFNGSFTGFFIDFVAKGSLATDLGRAKMDMQMVLKDGANKAKYAGNLVLEDFDLGRWTSNANFGKVSLSSNVFDGYGLTAELASASLKAEVQQFTFKEYTYKNATLTGQLNRNFFNGDFLISDDNIDFSFTGELDFRDSVPVFDFKANINRLALLPLNLSKQQLVLSGGVDLNIRNQKLSDLEGDASFKQLKIVKDDTETYEIDYIKIFAFATSTGENVFRLESDIASGEVRGNYDIDQLPASLQLFALRNYPGFAGRMGITAPRKTPDINEFSIDFHLNDSKGLNYLLDARLGNIRDLDFKGQYNGKQDSVWFELEVPSFEYQNVRLADAFISLDALRSQGDLDIIIDSTFINGKPRLTAFSLLSFLDRDTIQFGINISTDTPDIFDKVNLAGRVFLPDSTDYQLEFKNSNISLAKLPWSIKEDNRIRFGGKKIHTENFVLTNNQRGIYLYDKDGKGLMTQFINFDFSIIDHLWDYESLNFAGSFDMLVQIEDLFALQGISANINSEALRINKDNFGAFRLDAFLPDLKSYADVLLCIENDTVRLEADAMYNLADIDNPARPIKGKRPLDKTKDYLDLAIKTQGFPLDILEYWLAGGLRDTRGHFGADLSVKGLTSALDIEGGIDVWDGGFTIEALQTRYTFPHTRIKASNDFFDVSGTQIFDKYGNVATVEGGLTHQRLKNLGMNARMRTNRFLGLDLKRGDNDVFYGRALGAGEVRFSGDFQRPNISVNATVADSTFIVIPITDQVESSDLNFVQFINKHQKSEKTESATNTKVLGLNLEMDLRITEVADLELIFDEKAGDILRGRGRGNLRIVLPRAESFQMYGDITVTSGNYLFTLMDFINKEFDIKSGGTINWTGDPLNAQIDIAAGYKDLRTPLSSFIPEYLLTAPEGERVQAQQPTVVDLDLQLKGDLFKPDITFDMRFPNLRGYLQNLAENKLTLLRRDENEMNRQVFGLIVLGQFLPSDLSFNSNGAIANTLSEYFSNQMSLLLTDLLGNLIGNGKTVSSLDFDVVYNRGVTDSETLTSRDALEISLKSGLFNDRVSLGLGGNFAFGQATQSGAFFGEEIILEYAISANRDLKLRLYERRDQDLGTGRRIQAGAGLSWRKEFNSFHEFWDSVKRK